MHKADELLNDARGSSEVPRKSIVIHPQVDWEQIPDHLTVDGSRHAPPESAPTPDGSPQQAVNSPPGQQQQQPSSASPKASTAQHSSSSWYSKLKFWNKSPTSAAPQQPVVSPQAPLASPPSSVDAAGDGSSQAPPAHPQPAGAPQPRPLPVSESSVAAAQWSRGEPSPQFQQAAGASSGSTHSPVGPPPAPAALDSTQGGAGSWVPPTEPPHAPNLHYKHQAMPPAAAAAPLPPLVVGGGPSPSSQSRHPNAALSPIGETTSGLSPTLGGVSSTSPRVPQASAKLVRFNTGKKVELVRVVEAPDSWQRMKSQAEDDEGLPGA